jgi:ribonuclease P protein component
MGLPGTHRMTRSGEYAAVRTKGTARSGRLMTLAFLADEAPGTIRFGFTITKRVGNAVHRNKLRRRLREIARHTAPSIQRPGRLVTIPRPIASEATFAEIQSEWQYLVRKLGLLPPAS